LPITNRHIYNYRNIPLHQEHRDPFDRLLIATAHEENAIILSKDGNFGLYTDLIQVFW
jgi:PIN domain nuclease of toxin-antitoxin system